ncbi:hypothetical protein HA052_11085 [Chromobacterium haemolyticum]|uniref:Uncharacterized protein n=1 Tax=Chromobacterium fluminis TaxID=3044269 RepID=A0ABX0L8D1_9NEIS|nr:hypothetical protein [Chromobacterium haemolyticum]NHR05744.1 hypothetical protein [Chromobacterium haemolyticum]
MKLQDLSRQERLVLAEATSTNEQYLYQCGVGLKNPSPKLCRRIIEADPRFTLPELRPDIWDVNTSVAVSSNDECMNSEVQS